MIAPHEMIVDLFAGGGGASTGILQATGRHPDLAVNHDAVAIACHTANHPTTRHEQASIWAVEPRAACAVQRYRDWLAQHPELTAAAARADLRGKPLCCWCPPQLACHADVLLELANAREAVDA